MTYYVQSSELYHYGIKGQKWGIRRYQNEDGTLTEAGKQRLRKSGEYTFNDDVHSIKSGSKLDKVTRGAEKYFIDRRGLSNMAQRKTGVIGSFLGTRVRDIGYSMSIAAPTALIGGLVAGPLGSAVATGGLVAAYAMLGAREITRIIDTVDYAKAASNRENN